MSRPISAGTIRAQALMGRRVYDASGKELGRVYDVETKRIGDDLCVTALLVGARTWLTRFGWTEHEHGQRVPWEEIQSLSPHITVRRKKGA
jgi:sporulation protein YlmC with PRC-barrel domain